jgi:DNA-directed RNA polymerase specialized sigma24 family protein
MNQTELDKVFDSHEPTTEEDALAHEQVRHAFKRLAHTMSNLPSGRERAIVMTKLEEASFFAHAAIGRKNL